MSVLRRFFPSHLSYIHSGPFLRHCAHLRRAVVMVLLAMAGVPDALAADPFFAEVTATEVNVRSGPSTNYYIVTKLRAGDRVEVREEDSGWYGIVPPPGCFSLISKHYVDLDGEHQGVVNGNSVRVRAGSRHDSRRYAVQTKLNEGDMVEILSSGPEGFLEIKPPQDAHIWMHSDLLARVSDRGAMVGGTMVGGASTQISRPKAQQQNPQIKQDLGHVTTITDSKTSHEKISAAPGSSTTIQPGNIAKVTDDNTGANSLKSDGHSAMTDSTDRVAVYTWSDESTERVRVSDSRGGTADTATTRPAITAKVPANIQQSVPASEPKTFTQPSQPSVSVSNTNTTSHDVDTLSTTRTSQFSGDSTDRVAIIEWNDDNQSTTTKVSGPVESTNQPYIQPTQSFTTTPIESTSSDQRSVQPRFIEQDRPVSSTDSQVAVITHSEAVMNDRSPTPPITLEKRTFETVPYMGSDPRAELKRLDNLLVVELDNSLEERQFGELMAQYRGVMEADIDEASKLYAGRRIHQMEVLSIRLDAVGQMNNLVIDVSETRHSASIERTTFGSTVSRPQSVGFAATGELRESMVFTSPVGPRRYRLIDPNEEIPRTICYVEIPRDSTIDVSRFLGRIVGIRASREFIETGNVDPIPVLVASAIEPVSDGSATGLSRAVLSGSSARNVASETATYDDSNGTVTRRMEPVYNK